ncbi:lachesin [Drosophila busckii]|uniref:lachesin n=1 Tax=Drosophila busckii TaxID=30019 RepID=UPI00083EF329|nr:lachesin [Drosophila busckii]
MRDTTWLLLICFLIGQFYVDVCHSKPAGADEDYQADDYDYGEVDDESGSTVAPPPLVAQAEPAPYFEQSDLHIEARPGSDVILNCDVRNFGLRNVVMWYRNSTILSTGQNSINDQEEVLKNNSLRIRSVTKEHANDYYCVVLPQNVRQHTQLRVSPRLSILCDDRDVTDRSQTFKQGDHHKLVCRTFLPNKAEIKWSFNGQRLESSSNELENGVITLDNVDESNVGVYQCLGDDGSSEPAHGMVHIDVQYSPRVSTHRHHVNTQEGSSAELYCDYRANPIAIFFFTKDGKPLTVSDKYSLRDSVHKAHNRTTLIIKHVQDSDLGEYLCNVENSIGSNQAHIELSYNPETPQFESINIDGNVVTMHWLVRSLQPLSEAMLDYKFKGSYSWSTVSVIQTRRHETDSGFWKITHQMELTPGVWHARVKTKNTHGWSHFSPDHDFVIKEQDDIDASDIDDGELPPDDLVRAGIGGGGGGSKKNVASALSVWPVLMFISFGAMLLRA